MEVSGNAGEIARILEPHVARVVVVSPSDTGIRQARAKTDRLDARTLARLLAAGSLDAVWMPDQRTRVMRRRLARRSGLVEARTRLENEIHARSPTARAEQPQNRLHRPAPEPTGAPDNATHTAPRSEPTRNNSQRPLDFHPSALTTLCRCSGCGGAPQSGFLDVRRRSIHIV
jgi:hypothetical protein